MSRFVNGKNNNSDDDAQSKYVINEQIDSDKVLVIGHDGENLGEMSKIGAIDLAKEKDMDLVQVGNKNTIPVARIIDFGKFLYMKKKQLADAKKKQTIIHVKEIKIRPNIGDQDYKTKLNHAIQFFKEGKKVKFTLQFKGREIGMMENVGAKLFERITNDLRESGVGDLVEEKSNRGVAFLFKIFGLKT